MSRIYSSRGEASHSNRRALITGNGCWRRVSDIRNLKTRIDRETLHWY